MAGRKESPSQYEQHLLELYVTSVQERGESLKTALPNALGAIADSTQVPGLENNIRSALPTTVSHSPSVSTQETVSQTEYTIQTPYGPLTYDSNTREGTSPLLPKEKNSFYLTAYQSKILIVFLEKALTARDGKNPRSIIVNEEELDAAIDDKGSEKHPNTKVFVSQIRGIIGDIGKTRDRKFTHKLIRKLPNTKNYFFVTGESKEIPYYEELMLKCQTIVGEIKFDPSSKTAFIPTKPGIPIPLSPKEAEIFSELFTDPGYHKFSGKSKKEKVNISVFIHEINKKLGSNVIENKQGLGWRFVPPKKARRGEGVVFEATQPT